MPIELSSFDTELLFICGKPLQTGQRRRYLWEVILSTSKTLSRSLNFLDFDVYVVMTPIFPKKSEEMGHFLKKRGYPDFVVNTA